MRATSVLRAKGVSIEHLHITTHKPFTDPAIREALQKAKRGVITLENHTIVGGLGSAVAETMTDIGCGTKLVRLGLKDTYAHGASRPYLMREYGLDALSLVRAFENLLRTSFGLSESDLAAVRLEAVHSEAKAEAL
jgi:transketolase